MGSQKANKFLPAVVQEFDLNSQSYYMLAHSVKSLATVLGSVLQSSQQLSAY